MENDQQATVKDTATFKSYTVTTTSTQTQLHS